MKKTISLLLVFMLLMSVVVGCAKKPVDNDSKTPAAETPKDKPEDDGKETSEGKGEITKVGLGNMVSIEKSAETEGDKPAKSQADITVAAVGFDKDGKVQSITIDVSQPKVEFDGDMKIASDIEEEVKSKHELKEDYDMKKASPIGKEWYEQMNSFQEWMIGQTVEEITGMKTKAANKDHPIVPDVEELTSTVTMDVGDYLAVVQDAWDNAKDVEGAEKVGLGFKTTLGSSKDMEDDKNAFSQADATMTATAFDSDGKILKTTIDTVQVKVEYDKDGKLVTDKEAEVKTKHELKEDYGMKETSEKIGIGKEWYEQMNSFQEWMEDQTVEEVTGMKTKAANEDHPTVPDVEELTSTVTMDVGGYLEVIQKAWDNAK